LQEVSDMAGEILVSGEARGGSISTAIVTDEQRSLKPKDPCPFRKKIKKTMIKFKQKKIDKKGREKKINHV